jgi:hypothetical protein
MIAQRIISRYGKALANDARAAILLSLTKDFLSAVFDKNLTFRLVKDL